MGRELAPAPALLCGATFGGLLIIIIYFSLANLIAFSSSIFALWRIKIYLNYSIKFYFAS